MNALRVAWSRLRSFLRKRELDHELSDELGSHIELLTEEHLEQGMTPVEARRQAYLKLGGIEPARELVRETQGLPLLDSLAQDLRYTFRMLRKDLGFAVFAILIVGCGVGASCTVFSVVNTLLLRPLPFANPRSLVWLANNQDDGKTGWSGQTTQVGYLLDMRRTAQSFSDLAGYFAFYKPGDYKLTGRGEPERLTGIQVTENFFPVLGIEPQLGRPFSPEECKWNGPRVVLLGHGLWQRRFASDPSIVGQAIVLDDHPATVVGVLPATFDFATVLDPGIRVDLYAPFPLGEETNRWGNTMAIIARLAPGASLASAQAELDVLGPRLQKEHPERNSLRPRVTRLSDHVSGRLRPAVLVLAGAVLVVMLIVCANLSNLLLARSVTRRKEIAIRAALGAGRRRLIRQMLTESVVLASCGAALGLLLAFFGTRMLAHLSSVGIPLLANVALDRTALGFALLVALLAGILFGLVPAFQVPALALHDSLKDSTRGSSEGRGHAWIRSGLVVSEIALACVLVVSAGLLLRSFLMALEVNLGFHPERAAALRIDPNPSYSTQEKRNAYFTEALRSVREVPGIEAAGLTDVIPFSGNRSWGVAAKGQQYTRDNYPEAFVRITSDGYFRAMGIPLRAGRDFSGRDTPDSEQVIIVNESLANRLWPLENPIGKILNADKPERTVVGVVGDVRHLSLEETSGLEMYLPMRQTQDYAAVDLVVRTSMAPRELASRIREALRPIEPDLPTTSFRTVQALVDKVASPRRFVVLLLGGFAVFAVILASLGIYAVISYSVGRRTQEIGIRMALGASARMLEAGILRETLSLAAAGMAIGVLASWALGRAMSGLLFGVTPTDPATFAGMVVLLTAVAALAGYLPAHRASRIDPIDALRSD